MLNNKKAWHICGKGMNDYFKYAFSYEVCANVLENFKYGGEFVRISYSSKYYKYCKGLPKDMQQFYIHCGLPCQAQKMILSSKNNLYMGNTFVDLTK